MTGSRAEAVSRLSLLKQNNRCDLEFRYSRYSVKYGLGQLALTGKISFFCEAAGLACRIVSVFLVRACGCVCECECVCVCVRVHTNMDT